MKNAHEQMNIVIVGHVDHGKSTVIGRLLADTGSLPEGKLDQVRRNCELNAKPFEYAFLLDALHDEQAQGITIDTARCFFKTEKRRYIIIDAPGHIEFLKNMVTGAARAEAALLVIDAHEGVRDNSRRHGYILSMLGIRQIVVLVNKMDLVDYSQVVFEKIKGEYQAFLDQIHIKPQAFIPISAREGENLIAQSPALSWYQGPSVLQQIDDFQKEKRKEDQPLRMPVQDIYKFTEDGDDRRIVAGTIETGRVGVGDEVIFLPSQKRTVIKSIEGFNEPLRMVAEPGRPVGFTVAPQIYIKPGEIMCKGGELLTHIGSTFRANLFWLGKHPMIRGKRYKLKLATNRATVYLREILMVLDASDLSTQPHADAICRHDVAECVLQTVKPIAFDCTQDIECTGRFVLIDDYEIVGGGIIAESLDNAGSAINNHVIQREYTWDKGSISVECRTNRFHHKPKFIVVTGGENHDPRELAKGLEEALFHEGRNVYYLGLSSIVGGLEADNPEVREDREEQIRRLGELGRILSDAGLIVVAAVPGLDEFELDILRMLNEPYEILTVIQGMDPIVDTPLNLRIGENESRDASIEKIKEVLQKNEVLLDYYL